MGIEAISNKDVVLSQDPQDDKKVKTAETTTTVPVGQSTANEQNPEGEAVGDQFVSTTQVANKTTSTDVEDDPVQIDTNDTLVDSKASNEVSGRLSSALPDNSKGFLSSDIKTAKSINISGMGEWQVDSCGGDKVKTSNLSGIVKGNFGKEDIYELVFGGTYTNKTIVGPTDGSSTDMEISGYAGAKAKFNDLTFGGYVYGTKYNKEKDGIFSANAAVQMVGGSTALLNYHKTFTEGQADPGSLNLEFVLRDSAQEAEDQVKEFQEKLRSSIDDGVNEVFDSSNTNPSIPQIDKKPVYGFKVDHETIEGRSMTGLVGDVSYNFMDYTKEKNLNDWLILTGTAGLYGDFDKPDDRCVVARTGVTCSYQHKSSNSFVLKTDAHLGYEWEKSLNGLGTTSTIDANVTFKAASRMGNGDNFFVNATAGVVTIPKTVTLPYINASAGLKSGNFATTLGVEYAGLYAPGTTGENAIPSMNDYNLTCRLKVMYNIPFNNRK